MLSGQAAAELDREVRERYLSPSFKFDEGAHAGSLAECARMRGVLASGEWDEKLLAPTEVGTGGGAGGGGGGRAWS